MALREAVNEEDFGPIWIAPVLRRNGEAVGRLHRDRLELLFLRLTGRCKSDENRDRHSDKVVPTRCVDHYRPPSLPMRVRTDEPMKRSCSLDQTEAIVRPPACTFHVGGARTPCLRSSKSDGQEVRLVPIAPTADFCSAPLMETSCGKCRPAPRGLMESIRRVSAIFGYYLSAGQPTTAGGRTCG